MKTERFTVEKITCEFTEEELRVIFAMALKARYGYEVAAESVRLTIVCPLTVTAELVSDDAACTQGTSVETEGE